MNTPELSNHCLGIREERNARTAAQEDWGTLDESITDSHQVYSELEHESRKGAETRDTIGAKGEVKTLYASIGSACRCCTTWDDKKPYREHEETSKRAKEDREAYAIVHRKTPHAGDRWETHSIDINSPNIKSSVNRIFSNYPSFDLHCPDMSFSPAFTPFVHRWKELIQTVETETDLATKEHMALFVKVLEPEIKQSFRVLQNFNDTGYITFKGLGLPFVPEDIVVHTSNGELRAGILRDVTLEKDYSGEYFKFRVKVVDWNGHMFGVGKESWTLYSFAGSRKLETLDIFPLRIHPNREGIQRNLVERGKAFENLRGQHIRYYDGDATYQAIEKTPFGNHGRDAFRPVSSLNRDCTVHLTECNR
jgi:hypothetical protein